jgi:hypothetical protein
VIGATGAYKDVVKRHFPYATLESGDALSTDDLVSGKADAWIWSHVPAFVWCLNHPDYMVVDYEGLIGKRYFAYPVRMGSNDFVSFINNWLTLKEQSKFTDRQYKYWILGEKAETPTSQRWSILREVLHWVR